MNEMSKEQCTHTKIVYRPIGGDGIGWTPRWICYECGLEFSPKKQLQLKISKLEDRIKKAINLLDTSLGDTDPDEIDYYEFPAIHAMHILIGVEKECKCKQPKIYSERHFTGLKIFKCSICGQQVSWKKGTTNE